MILGNLLALNAGTSVGVELQQGIPDVLHYHSSILLGNHMTEF